MKAAVLSSSVVVPCATRYSRPAPPRTSGARVSAVARLRRLPTAAPANLLKVRTTVGERTTALCDRVAAKRDRRIQGSRRGLNWVGTEFAVDVSSHSYSHQDERDVELDDLVGVCSDQAEPRREQ